jgi:YtkA-like
MSRLLVAPLACLIAMLPSHLSAGCLPAGAAGVMRAPESTTFEAALQTDPAPVIVGAPFAVKFHVCAAGGKTIDRLTIDATMPAHRHGMNYKPEIAALGDGKYEARGFLFHMPGQWEITLSVYSGGTPSYLKLNLDVK